MYLIFCIRFLWTLDARGEGGGAIPTKSFLIWPTLNVPMCIYVCKTKVGRGDSLTLHLRSVYAFSMVGSKLAYVDQACVSRMMKISYVKYAFVCLFEVFLSQSRIFIFSLIWRGHRHRWRAANFDLYSALIAIKISVPYLYCDTGHQFMMVISEYMWRAHLLPIVWQ